MPDKRIHDEGEDIDGDGLSARSCARQLADAIRAQQQVSIESVNRNGKVKSFEFGWELVKSLVTPNMHARVSRGGL